MKNFILILAIFTFCISTIKAQCPSGDLEFISQQQIDQFIIDYPNCTEIEGEIIISSEASFDIENLNGLINITSIGGRFYILYCFYLENLDGLVNLTSIGGDFIISNTFDLENLDGLINLTHIEGVLDLSHNFGLTNIDGLSNLSHVGDYIQIQLNNALKNVDGFSGLTSINGIYFRYNENLLNVDGLSNITEANGSIGFHGIYKLENLNGLSGITNIEGGLGLSFNQYLNDVSGLNNITEISGYLSILGYQNDEFNDLSKLTKIGGNFYFDSNSNISICCDIPRLINITEGYVYLTNNAPGCNSLEEIAEINCDSVTNEQCPSGDLEFTSQQQIDQFIIDYPNCTEIEGDILISDNFNEADIDITNVDAFINLTSISGIVFIYNNDVLTSLNGFSNVTYIQSYLSIGGNKILTNIDGFHNLTNVEGDIELVNNNLLNNIDGLNGLTNIGGTLWITNNNTLSEIISFNNLASVGENVSIYFNHSLEIINGFGSLVDIGGDLWVGVNEVFIVLKGLDKLESIGGDLLVTDNPLLSECCIVPQLNNVTIGDVNLYNNATGCNSLEEIAQLNCDSLTSNITTLSPDLGNVRISPNPAKAFINVAFNTNENGLQNIKIYDVTGKLVLQQKGYFTKGENTETISINHLKSGLYFLTDECEKGRQTIKFLVE